MTDQPYSIYKMDYYIDRATRTSSILYIADECVKGNLYLWDIYFVDISEYDGNPFNYEFAGEDIKTKKEYLYSLDCLSYVLSAYQMTGKEIYRETFENIINKFYEFIDIENLDIDKLAQLFGVSLDLPVLGQTLLLVKAIDIIGDVPHRDKLLHLLEIYAEWLTNEKNSILTHNHGMFQVIALLHISVVFGKNDETERMCSFAINQLNHLYSNAYFRDHTNNEHSLLYFRYNNYLYNQTILFCDYYNIKGIDKVKNNIADSKNALCFFAHSDKSLPLIGDGALCMADAMNMKSICFKEIGIGVFKIADLYLSFKAKTVYQAHAHMDLSSITARYRDIDFIIDSGQYNYDRYTPINRFVRSSAGHSGIFPVYADNMFQKEFCDAITYSGIVDSHFDEKEAYVEGRYQIHDVTITRTVCVLQNEIVIKDSFVCQKPTAIRQRFVIPKELMPESRFSVSERTLSSRVENVKFNYVITADNTNSFTAMNFGVASQQYKSYETTMLLDTIVQDSLSGMITARITITEE